MRWFGYVSRMNGEILVRHLYEARPEKRKAKGRTWIDEIEAATKSKCKTNHPRWGKLKNVLKKRRKNNSTRALYQNGYKGSLYRTSMVLSLLIEFFKSELN